jgi:hypothetical protein
MSVTAAEQLAQLSSIRTLAEVRLKCSAAAAAACWALPLKAQRVSSDDATPPVLQQLATVQGLTSLVIAGGHWVLRWVSWQLCWLS